MECAFGILYSKWRIISKAIDTEVELADKIVKYICVLHNTITEKEGFERHLTDVTVQSKSSLGTTREASHRDQKH